MVAGLLKGGTVLADAPGEPYSPYRSWSTTEGERWGNYSGRWSRDTMPWKRRDPEPGAPATKPWPGATDPQPSSPYGGRAYRWNDRGRPPAQGATDYWREHRDPWETTPREQPRPAQEPGAAPRSWHRPRQGDHPPGPPHSISPAQAPPPPPGVKGEDSRRVPAPLTRYGRDSWWESGTESAPEKHVHEPWETTRGDGWTDAQGTFGPETPSTFHDHWNDHDQRDWTEGTGEERPWGRVEKPRRPTLTVPQARPSWGTPAPQREVRPDISGEGTAPGAWPHAADPHAGYPGYPYGPAPWSPGYPGFPGGLPWPPW